MPSCFVPGCKNRYQLKKSNISYHAFPKKLTVQWLQAIGRDHTTFINQQRLCSEHFLNEDFEKIGSYKKLKPNVIPSVSLPKQVQLDTSPRTSNMPGHTIGNTSPPVVSNEMPKLVAVANYIQSLPTELVLVLSTSSNSETVKQTVFIKPRREQLKPHLFKTNNSDTSTTASSPMKKRKTSLSSATEMSKCSASSRTKKRMIKTFHTYSLSPNHYIKQIHRLQEKLNYYKQKYYVASRTSRRLKIKINNLKSVLVDLKK